MRESRKNFKQRPFAKKSLGQNFLCDSGIIANIVDSLQLGEGDTVIEIGPGRGALTRELVRSGAKVVAIEIDRDLVPELGKEFESEPNFTVLEADALEIDFDELFEGRAKLVANLPYYISTAILRRLSEYSDRFSKLVVMLQKEVVERIVAPPGDRERGFLTVIVEAFFVSRKLFDVPPGAFRPVPKVTSAVIELVPRVNSRISNRDRFIEIVSAGFRQKRKTILNNLRSSGPLSTGDVAAELERHGIAPTARAEELSIKDWERISG